LAVIGRGRTPHAKSGQLGTFSLAGAALLTAIGDMVFGSELIQWPLARGRRCRIIGGRVAPIEAIRNALAAAAENARKLH
jgi:hypothetical protein